MTTSLQERFIITSQASYWGERLKLITIQIKYCHDSINSAQTDPAPPTNSQKLINHFHTSIVVHKQVILNWEISQSKFYFYNLHFPGQSYTSLSRLLMYYVGSIQNLSFSYKKKKLPQKCTSAHKHGQISTTVHTNDMIYSQINKLLKSLASLWYPTSKDMYTFCLFTFVMYSIYKYFMFLI